MHIPDGYLSPITCGVAYAAALPFWLVASRRISGQIQTRAMPLIALVSAFSFVVMMFNLPLPGGTTGHAVGMGISAIILGPWASIAAISVALLVQALLFGDGGLTTYGANSLNMAIVGSLVAYAVYRLVAGRAPLGSGRRVIAGALAGYVAINMAALCAGIEFGIQPGLFHDASGAPLYAPYSLSVAVPAMLLGHLTFAGLAELLITGGLVSYLQKADPSLLQRTAPNAAAEGQGPAAVRGQASRLWLYLGGLMILSPLGLLAAGTAWGEWGTEDFGDAPARQAMAMASGNVAPPDGAPLSLERLAGLWSAPFPNYAPAFVHSDVFGYVLSAMLGGGVILIVFVGLAAVFGRGRPQAQHLG